MSHIITKPPFRSTLDVADMAEYMQRVGEQSSELLGAEWNLLSVVYKNAVDSRRAAWCVITSIEQNEKLEGKEQLASHAREYIAEVERELQKIRDGILALMDKNLIPSASTDESKMLYYKMKSDCYRYLAECATGDAKDKATEGTCAAYAEATKIAEKDLVVTHPVRLAMALSSVVAQRQNPIDQTVQKTVETPQLQRKDRVSDGPVVQVEHVPQSHVAEMTVEIPHLDVVKKTVETSEIQQRNVEQIVDTPVLPVVEELAEASKVFSQDRVQQRFGESVEPPEKINQVTKHVEIPRWQIVEKTVKTPGTQRIQGSESMGNATARQVVEIEASLTVESASPMFVSKPVSETPSVVVEYKQPTPVVEYMANACGVRDSRAYRCSNGPSDHIDSGANSLPTCSADRHPQRKLHRKQRRFHRSDTLTKLWVCQLWINAKHRPSRQNRRR